MKKPTLAPDEQSPLVRRILERLDALQTNATAVSLTISDNKDLLRDILNGRTKNPRTDTIRKVADALGTTVEWLMEGDGEPAPAPLAGRPTSNVRMAGVKAPVLATLARDVPVMGTAAGSLGGAFQFEGGVVDYVARPPALVGAKNAYSMYVEGSSMVPEHNPGDLRFIHPDRKAHIGDSVVVTAKYSEHGPYESFIKHLVRRTETKLIVQQLNPPATIEFDMQFVASVHKVLTMNDLFGV
ncbi:helix-turn-helix transcriptional regulator [Bosea sp. F3-2]|uniref:XRE family transcriptional regulator n=1 Tax=Bosea sp. F3-2 TaxID=2599640 RepID=UPI0016567118|nr:helix-turn-helix transcriptional regulator [Bosea sp. F3-2]